MNVPIPNTISLTDLARHGTLLRERMSNGPVFLTKSGKTVGVVLSAELYELMLAKFSEGTGKEASQQSE